MRRQRASIAIAVVVVLVGEVFDDKYAVAIGVLSLLFVIHDAISNLGCKRHMRDGEIAGERIRRPYKCTVE